MARKDFLDVSFFLGGSLQTLMKSNLLIAKLLVAVANKMRGGCLELSCIRFANLLEKQLKRLAVQLKRAELGFKSNYVAHIGLLWARNS